MGSMIETASTKPPADVSDRVKRLSVARSHAFSLLTNGQPDEEIREAIDSGLRADIAAALDEARHDAVIANELPLEGKIAFIEEINKFIRLTGGGWPAEQRQEWQDQAVEELGILPVRLSVPAIRAARQSVWDPKRFVSWVLERVLDDQMKLSAELARLERLAAIAAE